MHMDASVATGDNRREQAERRRQRILERQRAREDKSTEAPATTADPPSDISALRQRRGNQQEDTEGHDEDGDDVGRVVDNARPSAALTVAASSPLEEDPIRQAMKVGHKELSIAESPSFCVFADTNAWRVAVVVLSTVVVMTCDLLLQHSDDVRGLVAAFAPFLTRTMEEDLGAHRVAQQYSLIPFTVVRTLLLGCDSKRDLLTWVLRCKSWVEDLFLFVAMLVTASYILA